MKTIIRDVAIVWSLTFLSGVIVGFLVAQNQLPAQSRIAGLALANGIFSVVGFTIVGALARKDRFKHMARVCVVAWLVGLTNVIFGSVFKHWLLSLLFLFTAMLIGWALSFLFSSPRKLKDVESSPAHIE